ADYMARTALDRAVDSGNQAISSMLAEAGALGGYEMHPLHYTCALADNAVISLAIEAGEDVNAADTCGWSALHYAAMSGSADTVTLLLSAGADVNATDSQGATALTRSPLHVREIV